MGKTNTIHKYTTPLKMAIKNGLFVILMILTIALCLGLPIKRKRATTGVGAVSVITLNLLEDTLKNGTKITQTAIKLIEKNLEKLNNLMDEADINIRKIQNATEEIELENIQITKEFLDQYYLSKGELREARQTLRKLAEKTISACKDIKLLIESWEDTSTVYVEKQFSIMKQLLKESAPILEQASEKYNNAISAIDRSTSQLQIFANK